MATAPPSTAKTAHVAVIAYPFTSHPISLHSLVARLARASPETRFTFLNTPTSNASLFGSPHLPPNLIPYALEDGIPAGRDASEISYPEANELFQRALLRPGSLREALDGAVEAAAGAEFTCLLVCSAILVSMTQDVAELAGRGVPWIAVWTSAPRILSSFVHADLIRHRISGEDLSDDIALDFVPGLAGMRFSDVQPRQIFIGELDKQPRFLQGLARLGPALSRASAVVLSSFRELNPDELNADLKSRFGILLNVGFYTVPIPPPQRGSDPTGCLAWLDGQKARSVAYICFGTALDLPEDELRATAEALSESGVAFLWCIRDSQRGLLPGDFAERTRSRGRLVPWTNQVQVLAHGAVGVNVSHCGYNSVSECVANGVPVVGRPFWGDNQLNARTVESAWGMGVTLKALTKDGLVKAFEEILEREEGERMRERALALKTQLFQASSPAGSASVDFNSLLRLLSAV